MRQEDLAPSKTQGSNWGHKNKVLIGDIKSWKERKASLKLGFAGSTHSEFVKFCSNCRRKTCNPEGKFVMATRAYE